MQIFDPIAGVYFNPLVMIALGVFAGLAAGMVGLGGGIILVPSMILYGVAPNIAAATANCYMVSAASSGLYAYLTRRLVDLKTGGYLVAGSFLGGLTGVAVVRNLLEGGQADEVIRDVFAGITGLIGVFMFLDVLRGQGAWRGRPCLGARLRSSIFITIFFGISAGLTSSILGIGGGVFIVPFLLYCRHFEARRAVGTSLMLILFMTAGVSVLHAIENKNLDILLAFFLLAGAGAGAQLGVCLSKKTSPRVVKLVFATIALAGALRLWMPPLEQTPKNLPSLKGIPLVLHEMIKLMETHSLFYGITSVCLALGVGLFWGRVFQGSGTAYELTEIFYMPFQAR